MVALNGWRMDTPLTPDGEAANLVNPMPAPAPLQWPVPDDDWADTEANELAREQARLEAEIAAAKARTAAAMHRAATSDADAKAMLREELLTAKRELADLERQHETTVAMIRQAAQDEVERILSVARDQAKRIAGGNGSDRVG
jgi:cell division septum initiation protein DivIVA